MAVSSTSTTPPRIGVWGKFERNSMRIEMERGKTLQAIFDAVCLKFSIKDFRLIATKFEPNKVLNLSEEPNADSYEWAQNQKLALDDTLFIIEPQTLIRNQQVNQLSQDPQFRDQMSRDPLFRARVYNDPQFRQQLLNQPQPEPRPDLDDLD